MRKPLILFVGKSASGKSTIANLLSGKYGYVQVESYTTRPQRYNGERGHIFVNEEEFAGLGELAAYTYYNNQHYGTTFEQLNESDIYVIDVPGVQSLLEKLKMCTRPIWIFYFDASTHNRILRMIERGDGNTMIVERLLQDEKDDWYKQLDSIVCKYAKEFKGHIDLYSINANGDLTNVLELVLYYIKQYEED